MIAAALTISCSHDAVYDWSWVDGLVKPIPEEYDWFNNKWGLAANYSFDDKDYQYDGAGSLRTTVEHTTLEDGQRMLRYLDEVIFPLLPETLVKESLPATIYLADKVNFTYTEEEYNGLKHSMEELSRSLYGDISVGHLTLATSMLDSDPDSLKFNVLSLVLERMMSNAAKWPEPVEFMAPAKTLIRDLAIYEPYYNPSINADKFYFNLPSGTNESGFTFWNYCGSVRPCRYGHFLHCRFVEDGSQIFSYYIFTWRQDLADTLAMLLLWTPEQIEAHLSSIDGQVHSYTSSTTGEVHVYTVDRAVFEKKIAAARNYMKDNFNIILQ